MFKFTFPIISSLSILTLMICNHDSQFKDFNIGNHLLLNNFAPKPYLTSKDNKTYLFSTYVYNISFGSCLLLLSRHLRSIEVELNYSTQTKRWGNMNILFLSLILKKVNSFFINKWNDVKQTLLHCLGSNPFLGPNCILWWE